MGQALYRKYRSRGFDDVVGQEHITDTLKKAIKSGRISHAYLFTGPRGVGKTSVARILAHEVNGLPYTGEEIHLDIIEIDGASNRRIDEIRDLRDKVHVSPTSAKYKVYIIDEVHMLTKEAFNALLKTLEEPPQHVIFILATTEAHKLPETIVSRTQRFEFKPIGADKMSERLAQIAKAEKISVEPGAVKLLAEHGEGSFRDSIGLLDQLSSSGGKISEEDVRNFLGLPPDELISRLVKDVANGRTGKLIETLGQVSAQGVGAAVAAKALSKNLRDQLVAGSGADWIPRLLGRLLEVPASHNPDISLEIALLEACLSNEPAASLDTVSEQAVVETEPLPEEADAEMIAEEPEPEISQKPEVSRPAKTKQFDNENWNRILDEVKAQAASLYTALRLAEPSLAGSTLTLSFQFPLHQKKLNQAKNKDIVAKAVSDVLAKEVTVVAVVKESDKPAAKSKSDKSFQAISNIFGQAEVLES